MLYLFNAAVKIKKCYDQRHLLIVMQCCKWDSQPEQLPAAFLGNLIPLPTSKVQQFISFPSFACCNCMFLNTIRDIQQSSSWATIMATLVSSRMFSKMKSWQIFKTIVRFKSLMEASASPHATEATIQIIPILIKHLTESKTSLNNVCSYGQSFYFYPS